MTNSPADPQPKTKKTKGPIRTGAVVPTLILLIAVGVFFRFFFDGLLRRGLEYAGTHVVGAEVDIGHLSTSFIHATLDIRDIQVTDKDQPSRNLVQIGAIRFGMLWDALLRAKIVINEAEILDIQALSPRQRPGQVLPPPPPPKPGQPSLIGDVESQVLAQTRKQYNGNFLGDIAGVLGSGGPKEQLKSLEGSLKSEARIKELQKDFAAKKAQWDARIKALPQGKELQQYNDRIKALKFDFNKPAELAKNVQAANQIIKEASEKVKVIDQTQKDLKSDLATYTQAYKDVEKLMQEDIRDLQGKLKLPNIDAKEFSQQLFMGMVEKKLGGLYKYVVMAEKYMPAKKAAVQTSADAKKAQEDAILPPKRGTGKTYRFPITSGYPLFWLKHAAISSQMNTSEFSGNIKGEIKDATTDPSVIGRPTLALVHGDFPKQGIQGLDAKITLDHTKDVAKDSLNMTIASFPVGENKLSDSPDVRLALAQAKGSSAMDAVFTDEVLTLNMKNVFHDIQFRLEAKNKIVQEIIDGVLKGIPTVVVNANVTGSLHDLDIHINSNLGDELSKGFQKQLQAKISDAKAQLQKLIDSKIGGDRNQLKGQLDQLTGGLTKDIDGKKAEADKIVGDAQKQVDSGQNGGQKQKLQNEGKKLLKKFLGG